MPIFHLHVIYDNEIVSDQEGGSFPDLATAKAEAFGALCSLAAHDVEKGQRIRVRQVDVVSAENEKLHSVTLAEAIAVILPADDAYR